jgi:uncharacterized membrane protein
MLVMPRAIPIRDQSGDATLNLRWLALVFFSVVLAAITATILLAAAGRPEAIALYVAFSAFCHQQIERTWLVGSEPLPVCVRCFGFYLGAFASAAAGVRFSIRGLLLAGSVALLTVGADIAGLWTAPPAVRWMSGVLLGWSSVSPLAGCLPVGRGGSSRYG